jgi:hypothetical protein
MIKFITKNDEDDTPRFGDVEDGQFFVCIRGCFCQKRIASGFASIIAYDDGTPAGEVYSGWLDSTVIREILRAVKKIEF